MATRNRLPGAYWKLWTASTGLVFGLPAGVIVDRVDRRTMMWAVDVGRGAVLLALGTAVSVDFVGLPLIYLAVLVLGIGETLFDTAAQAILSGLVAADALEAANGRLFGAQLTTHGFAGPPLGGWLFVAAAALPFFFDAATFLLGSALIVMLRGSFRPVTEERSGVVADLREGVAWLWRHG
jgi:MFS family permease